VFFCQHLIARMQWKVMALSQRRDCQRMRKQKSMSLFPNVHCWRISVLMLIRKTLRIVGLTARGNRGRHKKTKHS